MNVKEWLPSIKDLAYISGVAGGILWAAVVWGMDKIYVRQEALNSAVMQIQDTIREAQCENLELDISELEQTILYKSQQGKDHGLEDVQLARAKRQLDRMDGCRE